MPKELSFSIQRKIERDSNFQNYQSSPEKQNHQDVWGGCGGERLILKDWLMRLLRFGKSQICRVGQHAGDPGKTCNLSPKVVCWQNLFLLKEVKLCS